MKPKIFGTLLAVAALGLASGVYAQTPTPTTPAPAPEEVVYLPQLPSVASLMAGAKTQGVEVLKITQANGSVEAVYRYPGGQVSTVSYQVLPAGQGVAPEATAPAGGTVVYQTAPYPYYDPYYAYYGYPYWGWYAPVGIGIGIGGGWGWHGGWGGGWHGGGWHGGGRR